jgi:iron complex outermembrane receptor protein
MRLRFLLLASAMVGTPAMAQNAPANSGDAAASQSGLQDIIVTAQRREENLQKAALESFSLRLKRILSF